MATLTPDQRALAGKRLRPEQRDEIVARYIAGESSTALSAVYGVAPLSVRSLLRRRGVEIRPRWWAAVRDGKKRCNACEQWKPVADFYLRKERTSETARFAGLAAAGLLHEVASGQWRGGFW